MPIIRPEEEAIKRLMIYHPRRIGKKRSGDTPETFYLLTAEGDELQTAELNNLLWTI